MANKPHGDKTAIQAAFLKAIAKYPPDLLFPAHSDNLTRTDRSRAVAEIAQKLGVTKYRVNHALRLGRGKRVLEEAKNYPRGLLDPPGHETIRGAAVLEIASALGVSIPYVQQLIANHRMVKIGERIRAQEEAARANQLVSYVQMPFGMDLESLAKQFTSWGDFFLKFSILFDVLIEFARRRGDVYAAAFIQDMKEAADKGRFRSSREISRNPGRPNMHLPELDAPFDNPKAAKQIEP